MVLCEVESLQSTKMCFRVEDSAHISKYHFRNAVLYYNTYMHFQQTTTWTKLHYTHHLLTIMQSKLVTPAFQECTLSIDTALKKDGDIVSTVQAHMNTSYDTCTSLFIIASAHNSILSFEKVEMCLNMYIACRSICAIGERCHPEL